MCLVRQVNITVKKVLLFLYIMYLCLLFEVLSTRYVIRRQKTADPNNL